MPDWVVKLFPTNAWDHGLAIWLIVTCVAFGMSMSVVVLSLCIRLGRFFGPKISAIVEGHLATMGGLTGNAVRQTDLQARQVAMEHSILETQKAHGNTLSDHGEKLDDIGEKVNEIRDHVIVKARNRRPQRGEVSNEQTLQRSAPDPQAAPDLRGGLGHA